MNDKNEEDYVTYEFNLHPVVFIVAIVLMVIGVVGVAEMIWKLF